MPLVRWGSNETQRFVELYHRYPCLWDRNNANYKNRPYREQCCNEIVEAIASKDFDIDSCKYKIRNIRSHYLQELKKINEADEKGEEYIPILRWFPLMDSFMRDNVQVRFDLIFAFTYFVVNHVQYVVANYD